ncbi:MAG: glycosyltransferase family 39 protein, partial [Vicinamibacteria bacterium]
DILFNVVIMRGGLPAGQAEPFYYQPLYPYVLALTHVVFGEDTFGIVFLQRLGMWAAVLAAWRIAARLFGPREALATLAVAVVFALAALAPWTRILLGEAVFVPLVMVSAWTLVVVSQGAGTGAGVGAGVAGGLATLSRSTLLPAWIVVVPLVAAVRRRRALSTAPVAALAVALALVVGTATLRNWIASGQVVPIATSFAVNFELGNPPPPDLDPHDVVSHTWLAALPVDPRTARVIDGAWHAPGAFVAGLGRKALYVFGIFEPHIPGRGWSPWLVASSLLGLTGLLLAWRRGSGAPERWLPAALALSHFAAVTLIFPHAHGDRMILPFHALLLPYAGLAVAALVRPRYD